MAHTSSDHYYVSPSIPVFPNHHNSSEGNTLEEGQCSLENIREYSPESYDEAFDDEHVYANVQAMEEESRKKEQPPKPDVTETPIRNLGNGWLEYLTDTGRSYFFNSETGDCHWKPPRFMKPPSQITSVMTGADDHLDGALASSHGSSESPTEDQHASSSVPVSPLIPAKSLSDMLESADSGIGRTSLSVRNKVADKRISVHAVTCDVARRVDAFKSSEETAAAELAQHGHPGVRHGECIPGDQLGPFNRVPSISFSQKAIKCGTLERCKVAEGGNRVKKKEWNACYIFLSSAHLIFYKDEKSAEKSGRHYEAPLGMCDLRGGNVRWLNFEKDKRRKHVFELELIDGTIYQFTTVNSQDVNGWFHAIRQVIHNLPKPDAYPTPVLERSGPGGTILRTSSCLSHSHSGSPFVNNQNRHSTKKQKSKDVMSASAVEDKGSTANSSGTADSTPTRETIIEKLRRFFRSRPSIESLKEKGIYRTEPVFGNTLSAICQHEGDVVPRFIRIVTDTIESRGLDTDGLYRVSGNLSAVQRIRCLVDQDNYFSVVREDDVHVLTGALKLFFRELAEPIFPVAMAKEFINANRLSNGEAKVKAFDELLKRLPVVHRETLKVLFTHLLEVAKHADKNRMEAHNLAIMFGPSLFSSGIEPNHDTKKAGASKKKGADKKAKEKPVGVQSNSHLAFNMIMQGQTVEYLLKEFRKFTAFQESTYCL